MTADEVIRTHPLNCGCSVCIAFVSAPNASAGREEAARVLSNLGVAPDPVIQGPSISMEDGLLLRPIPEGHFRCASCLNVFAFGWSEAEANAEAERLWGVSDAISSADMEVICDDCFHAAGFCSAGVQ